MDLTTHYLGLELKHPVLASASPLSKTVSGVKRLEDGGAAAVVLLSLFEEQIAHDSLALDYYLSAGTESYNEALSYFPEASSYEVGPDKYLDLISGAKSSCSIPIIASLNGISHGGWTSYAALMEQAGADAIELNMYYLPTNVNITGAEIEQRYLDTLASVLASVKIPVAVKLSPYFSSTANMASQLAREGARGLVLFNRFYQPDFDLANLEVVPGLELSRSYDMRLPLHWTAILYGHVPVDISVTSGVHTAQDVLKCMMAGASVVEMASELLHHGPNRVQEIVGDIRAWMEEYEYESIGQMQGSMSQLKCPDPSAFERANYMKVLQSYHPRV
jgi:dihydroorotate dehydrogenase (fumarate)